MLFPGIYKMGKHLGLYSSGSAVFGKYRDFSICAFDGNNKKILQIKMQEPLKEDDLGALKARYRFYKSVYDDASSDLRIEFREILKPYSYKKIIKLTDEIIDLCNKYKISSVTTCDSCPNPDVQYYQYNNVPLALCYNCYSREKSKVNQANSEYLTADKNYLQGFAGALLFTIPGIFIQVLLFIFLKRLGALSSAIYCYLALTGFNKFKGKATPQAGAIIIFVSLAMTILGTSISYTGLLLYYTRDLHRVLEVLAMREFQNELKGNIFLQTGISSIFLVFEFFSLSRNWSTKTIREARPLL